MVLAYPALELRLMGAFFVALMSDARIRIHVGEEGGAKYAPRFPSAARA